MTAHDDVVRLLQEMTTSTRRISATLDELVATVIAFVDLYEADAGASLDRLLDASIEDEDTERNEP